MGKKSRVHSRKERMATLLLVERLGSVSKASRVADISRSTIYEWKQRFEEKGLEGLDPLPSTPRAHPQTTAKHVEEQIKKLALAHPRWGCDRIQDFLSAAAPSVSSTTIQKILNKSEIGSRTERWLALEKLVESQEISLSVEQNDFVSERNPCFPKCSHPRRGPGVLMYAGIWRLGKSEIGDQVYIITMVDTCSAYAFGAIVEGCSMSREALRLDIRVKEFYRKRYMRVDKILIADKFNVANIGLYSLGGSLTCIGPFINILKRPLIERPCCLFRFQKTVTEEFLRGSRRRKNGLNVASMDGDFQQWLEYYNWERAHEGYPNWSKIPAHPLR
nr:helix-turn-helix domain-containing protein [uncultured Roseovarius sp.]